MERRVIRFEERVLTPNEQTTRQLKRKTASGRALYNVAVEILGRVATTPLDESISQHVLAAAKMNLRSMKADGEEVSVEDYRMDEQF